jgi:hypothetical protein
MVQVVENWNWNALRPTDHGWAVATPYYLFRRLITQTVGIRLVTVFDLYS